MMTDQEDPVEVYCDPPGRYNDLKNECREFFEFAWELFKVIISISVLGFSIILFAAVLHKLLI